MNGTNQGSVMASQNSEHFDVVIVGAGISGVGGAYHLTRQCTGTSFIVLEAKESFGGTWLTHRYPGIRSDSDLYTFGYRFKPWTSAPIATAAEILNYMGEVIDENDLGSYIRLVLPGLIDKVRRLVHVIPDSRNAIFQVGPMQIAPPTARVRQSVIDKNAFAGPDFRNEEVAASSPLKVIMAQPLIENVIAAILGIELRVRRRAASTDIDRRRWLILHSRIDNCDYLYSLLAG